MSASHKLSVDCDLADVFHSHSCDWTWHFLSVILQICWTAASAASAPLQTRRAKWRGSRPPRPATPPSLPFRICPQSEHGRAKETQKDWSQKASLQGTSFLLRPSTAPSPRFGLSGTFDSEQLLSWLHVGFEMCYELMAAMDEFPCVRGKPCDTGTVWRHCEHQLLVEDLWWCLAFIVILRS